MTADDLKRKAAEKALDYVEPGMKLGLGTGSTARHFVDLLGARVKAGLEVLCVPTSEATRAQAAALGIPLTTLDETPLLDLTVDGADEIDDELRLIKGGGGALLREKIVAAASRRMIVIADASKRVATLGAFPLPVEVVRFGARRRWRWSRRSRPMPAVRARSRCAVRRTASRSSPTAATHSRLRVRPHRRARAAGRGTQGGARRGRERPVSRSRRHGHHRYSRRAAPDRAGRGVSALSRPPHAKAR